MQRLFQVSEEDQEEADHVLENYLKKTVRDMMYQAHVEAVKEYYRIILKQDLDDKLAHSIELEYEQYLRGKIKWCDAEVWPELRCYWCSEEFKVKRKRGQNARLNSEDIAQNHGGSRPFTEIQQVLVCMCTLFDVLASTTHMFVPLFISHSTVVVGNYVWT
jgi:hypothetical protein